jgi:hypothetical protein
MLYVLRYTIAAGFGRKEGFKVFSALADAMKLHHAAELKMQPKGPFLNCVLYETDASDMEAAILAVKAGSARQLDSGKYHTSGLEERSLVDMVEEMLKSKGPDVK